MGLGVIHTRIDASRNKKVVERALFKKNIFGDFLEQIS
jgi:hypothetical protein